ncbi:MAG: hypothetical protein AB8G11_01425 [Saprospiraceae bacterium]
MKDKKQHIENELSEIAPFLANLKKDNDSLETFNVPDDYFNKLSDSIFEKTILQPEIRTKPTIQQVKSPTIWTTISQYFQWLLRPGVAVIATSVVIVAAVGVYMMNQPAENQMAELTVTEIEEYVEENIEIFDEEQLAELVVTTIETEVPVTIEDIDAESLEEYIEENFIEDITIDELL